MTAWFITGCSTGLGRSLAEAVLDRGYSAVVTARDPAAVRDLEKAHPDTALALPLDVTQHAQVRFGGVGVLVNNAGYGYRAAAEEADDADVQQLFATHFFGAVDLIKAVLPGMRERRDGAIINISSIGARTSQPGSGYYSAAKSALEGLSASLRKEVGPLGITVMVVEPGGFRTDFAGRSLQQSAAVIADYAGTAGRRRKENQSRHGTQPGDPARAAQAIIATVEAPDPPSLLVLGSDALGSLRRVLDAQRAELDAWEPTSLSTDYPA